MNHVPINLNSREMLLAGMEGLTRKINAIYRNSDQQWGCKGKRDWQEHIESSAAEFVVSKYIDRHWTIVIGRHDGDVGEVEVRHTSYATGHLTLHPDDTDDAPFFLVTGGYGKYMIRGWLIGKAGKLPEYWSELQEGRPAFNVPQYRLCDPKDYFSGNVPLKRG